MEQHSIYDDPLSDVKIMEHINEMELQTTAAEIKEFQRSRLYRDFTVAMKRTMNLDWIALRSCKTAEEIAYINGKLEGLQYWASFCNGMIEVLSQDQKEADRQEQRKGQ